MKYNLYFIVCMILPVCSQAQQWRVAEDIYQRYDGQAFIMQDSTKYSYHPNYGRGSSAMNDTIRYDKRRKYRVNPGGLVLMEDFKQKFYPDCEIQVTERQGLDTVANKWVVQGIDSFTKSGKWLMKYMLYELLHKGGSDFALYATRRTIYNYDMQNALLMERIDQKSYAFSNTWVNERMNRYTYDNGRLLTDTIYYTGVGNVWKLNSKYEYTYDIGGRLQTKMFGYIDPAGKWDTSMLYTYKYNVQGQVDTMEFRQKYGGNVLVTAFTYHSTGEVFTDSTFGEVAHIHL